MCGRQLLSASRSTRVWYQYALFKKDKSIGLCLLSCCGLHPILFVCSVSYLCSPQFQPGATQSLFPSLAVLASSLSVLRKAFRRSACVQNWTYNTHKIPPNGASTLLRTSIALDGAPRGERNHSCPRVTIKYRSLESPYKRHCPIRRHRVSSHLIGRPTPLVNQLLAVLKKSCRVFHISCNVPASRLLQNKYGLVIPLPTQRILCECLSSRRGKIFRPVVVHRHEEVFAGLSHLHCIKF